MAKESGVIDPGEFRIEGANLYLSNGQTVNLLDPNTGFMSLVLEEDIEEAAIMGTLQFFDPRNVANRGPITGGEVIDMKIATSSEFSDESSIIDFSKNNLIVTGLGSYQADAHPSGAITSVTFCTQEIVENYRTRVSQSFEGTYTDIVEEIMEKVIKSGKNLYIEPSVNKKKIVAPNVPPFEVIRMAMEEAMNDQQEPTYYFYETTMGYHFRTLMDMYEKEDKAVLDYHDDFIGLASPATKEIKDNWIHAIKQILSFQVLSRSNLLANLDHGVYASKLIEHDIYNKTYQEYEYDYFDGPIETHIAPNEFIYSKKPIVNGNTLTKDKMQTYLVPTALKNIEAQTDAHHSSSFGTGSGNFPQYGFSAKNGKNWVQRRNSMRSQIADKDGATTMRLVVHGNTIINAGDVININISERQPVITGEANPDPVLSGAFLIKNIRHNFSVNDGLSHSMTLTVIKDSMPSDYRGQFDSGKSPSKGSFRKIESYYEAF
ncbi:MAG: hypothetical protein VX737_03470 [Pseudomonadota bacterium]|nr:hypothetical protein [Pseudomonadota bacterium]